MVLLSMFVSVVFDCAGLSSYEAWAIDWLKQSELMEQEREAAANAITTWWRWIQASSGKESGGKKQVGGANAEAYFRLRSIKKFKMLLEIQFKIRRAGGGD